jgi:hypothetical protein
MMIVMVLVPLSLLRADDSSLLFTAIRRDGSGVRLQVGYPDGFTNRLDLFVSTNLGSGCWTLVSQAISTAGTNAASWLDTEAGQFPARFYLVGDAGLDTDADGLPDARETLIHQTNPLVPDTDSDGIPDGVEITRGTDPCNGGSGALILYADSDIGNDAYDGRSDVVSANHGPKRSIRAAYNAIYAGDTISLQGGASFSEPLLCMGARSVVLCPQGDVTVRP